MPPHGSKIKKKKKKRKKKLDAMEKVLIIGL
jgi:hypothetical protein